MREDIREEMEKVPGFAERAACGAFARTLPDLKVMQVNVGTRCNLVCKHCHIEAGPARTERMPQSIMAACLDVFSRFSFETLDITGGAPELNPHLPWFIEEAGARGIHTIVRTNLAILCEKEKAHFPAFYARAGVELVASLPYYTEQDTDRQRGKGVFAASIDALKRLNNLGYGVSEDLPLHLVCNPGGAFLPPEQTRVTEEFKGHLWNEHGLSFHSLYTITNSPIGRFGDFLMRTGNMKGYLNRLVAAFNPATLENMMCRSQISVDWDGRIYDCDFNLALGLAADLPFTMQTLGQGTLSRRIVFGNHCYACTAGAGSSCGGATATAGSGV